MILTKEKAEVIYAAMLELNKIDSKLFALNVTQLSDGTSVSLLETATGLIAIGVGIEPKTDTMHVLV